MVTRYEILTHSYPSNLPAVADSPLLNAHNPSKSKHTVNIRDRDHLHGDRMTAPETTTYRMGYALPASVRQASRRLIDRRPSTVTFDRQLFSVERCEKKADQSRCIMGAGLISLFQWRPRADCIKRPIYRLGAIGEG